MKAFQLLNSSLFYLLMVSQLWQLWLKNLWKRGLFWCMIWGYNPWCVGWLGCRSMSSWSSYICSVNNFFNCEWRYNQNRQHMYLHYQIVLWFSVMCPESYIYIMQELLMSVSRAIHTASQRTVVKSFSH